MQVLIQITPVVVVNIKKHSFAVMELKVSERLAALLQLGNYFSNLASIFTMKQILNFGLMF